MPKRVPALPTIEYLYECFDYDQNTGTLVWKSRPRRHFSSDRACSISRKLFAGKKAGSFSYDSNGFPTHVKVIFRGHRYNAHRIVWAMHYRQWPIGNIDHIDGCKANNKIQNLRIATQQENSRNSRKPIDNTSGVLGVYWHKAACKWYASIGVCGATKYLGMFPNKESAIIARKNAEKFYGFHKNHGRD